MANAGQETLALPKLRSSARFTFLNPETMAEQHKKKRRRSEKQPPQIPEEQKETLDADERHTSLPAVGAPALAPAEPTGWEELDQPQDVQQQPGSIWDACDVQQSGLSCSPLAPMTNMHAAAAAVAAARRQQKQSRGISS